MTPGKSLMQVHQQTSEHSDAIDLMVNMGPQHPSTHGVFRLVIWVDGERIVRVEPHIGYLHRGSEKICESEQYNQIVTLFDRLDYVGNLNNELAFCLAVEKLTETVVPERAEYIRVILCELNRIASHMLFYGVYGLDAGATTPMLYGFRERERVQELFESVTGARMMHNYIRIGGVKEDVPADFEKNTIFGFSGFAKIIDFPSKISIDICSKQLWTMRNRFLIVGKAGKLKFNELLRF